VTDAEHPWARWLPWALLVVVLAGALAVGARSPRPPTLAERTRAVAATLRCPQCTDKSMAASDAPTSVAGRAEIRRQLVAGRSPDEIRGWFAARYGDSILLTPQRRGLEGLIWALPVVAFVVAAAALAAVFLRWRRRASVELTDDDRRLVDAARRHAARPGDAAGDGDGDGGSIAEDAAGARAPGAGATPAGAEPEP
jgi:cytochrome c-type biogenesis protein CcmH/NrfF